MIVELQSISLSYINKIFNVIEKICKLLQKALTTIFAESSILYNIPNIC